MLKLVFLGSGGTIQVPAFHCSCDVCEAARQDPAQRRTRASVAIIGQEVTLIDASPDIDSQLERESIRRVDRIFITHWHYDHIAGLAAMAEPSAVAGWPPIDVYLPHQVAYHFDRELAYMKDRLNLHLVQPGDRVELPDASWEVVKTTHTEHSVGYIIEATKRIAYLVDGVTPPEDTLERLNKLDILILEATLDELDEEGWVNFSLEGALACWHLIGAEQCVLTHLSCHRWKDGQLVAGLSYEERGEMETQIPGLRFAHDGMVTRV